MWILTPRVPADTEDEADRGQLEPAALIAEINMLLEFVSGRSDRTLGGGQQSRFPGVGDYNDALTKFFEIRQKVSGLADHPAQDPPPVPKPAMAPPPTESGPKAAANAPPTAGEHDAC